MATLLGLLAVRSHSPQRYAGDEPHYLVVANSLVLDGDVDVKNDYVNGRYVGYYPFPIDPHVNWNTFRPASPHWYPAHGIGLRALLAPAVASDGAHGAQVAMVVIAACSC